MDDLIVRDGRLVGIQVSPVTENSERALATTLEADAVVLGVGHSARDVYENLHSHNVLMTPKDFAVSSSSLYVNPFWSFHIRHSISWICVLV